MKEQPKQFACYYPLEKCDHQCPGCRFRKLDEVTTPKVEALISRVSGEPPKPDQGRMIQLLRWFEREKEAMRIEHHWSFEEIIERFDTEVPEKVSGEAKTPDTLKKKECACIVPIPDGDECIHCRGRLSRDLSGG